MINRTPANATPFPYTTLFRSAYVENSGAVAVDAGVTPSDIDSPNLASATVSIPVNYASGQDVLGLTNQLGITGSWNVATGVMTLTGSTTVANYQAALRAVTYL